MKLKKILASLALLFGVALGMPATADAFLAQTPYMWGDNVRAYTAIDYQGRTELIRNNVVVATTFFGEGGGTKIYIWPCQSHQSTQWKSRIYNGGAVTTSAPAYHDCW